MCLSQDATIVEPDSGKNLRTTNSEETKQHSCQAPAWPLAAASTYERGSTARVVHEVRRVPHFAALMPRIWAQLVKAVPLRQGSKQRTLLAGSTDAGWA